ncbi:hypothetical protein PFLUV_G00037620, partial [Perca fluviatilis]
PVEEVFRSFTAVKVLIPHCNNTLLQVLRLAAACCTHTQQLPLNSSGHSTTGRAAGRRLVFWGWSSLTPQTDMLPKTRLGKRSPFGALVGSSSCPPAGPGQETGETAVTMATAAGQQAVGRVKGHPGLKVYFQCEGTGSERAGAGELPNDLPVWSSSGPSSSSSPSCIRSVSSCIDVPRRSG